jgi:YegS/Rv2252/BmrU family lipid kinase
MQHALVIVNPHAQSGGASQRDRAQIAQKIELLPGVSGVDWVETKHSRHGVELAQQAVREGRGYIFAAGGDGTISEVMNGLMSATLDRDPAQRPIFGVLPWGTLNDFYMALEEAEKGLPEGFTQPLDIGQLRLNNKIEAFCCLSISIGLSSWANMQYERASRRFGRLFGLIPAVINTLLTYRRAPGVRLSLDHAPSQKRRFLAMAIGNCASVGGGVRLTPEAQIDDGWFDVSIIKEVGLFQLAILLITARLRRHYRNSAMDMLRAQHLELDAERPVSIHLDGELIPIRESQIKHLTLQVLPAALQVVRPSQIRG